MSDPKSSYGEPVEEPTPAQDDVVGSANEGLADAEAAKPAPEESVAQTPTEQSTGDAADGGAWYDRPLEETPGAAEPESAPVEPAAETRSAEPEAAESATAEPAYAAEPTTSEPAYTAEPATEVAPAQPAYASGSVESADAAPTVGVASPSPIFVQAPEAPRPRGNRGAAGAIGLLAAVGFAVLMLLSLVGGQYLFGDLGVADLLDATIAASTSALLWVPTIVFFLAFWILGAIINRGRWGAWVVFGILVGVAGYGGWILGALFDAPFWLLTVRQGAELIAGELLSPFAILSFIFARELTIWFGAWVARRGRRVTELNAEAQHEYERTLEAGPQLYRQ